MAKNPEKPLNLRQVLRQKQKFVSKIGHPEMAKQKRLKTFRVPGIK